MPERRRVAFVLCAIEGLSPRDAAQLEGVTRLTMRARLHSARREVERRMSHDPYVKRLVQEARR
jgi:RNA polymerase sigma-70 factor (ECF subfamily)